MGNIWNPPVSAVGGSGQAGVRAQQLQLLCAKFFKKCTKETPSNQTGGYLMLSASIPEYLSRFAVGARNDVLLLI